MGLVKIDDKAKKLIEENPLALSTIDRDGNPHCMAVAYVKVVSDDTLLITDNYMGRTLENLKRNPHICLVVWNNKDWEENTIGYRIKGIAEYFTEGMWYEMVKRMPENQGEPCKGAVLMKVEKIERIA